MANSLTSAETPAGPPKLALRPREAARMLSICPRTLATYTKVGAIPHTRLGKSVLYSTAELQAWLSRRAEPANGGER
jgi:excisionase family DNA binding protein